MDVVRKIEFCSEKFRITRIILPKRHAQNNPGKGRCVLYRRFEATGNDGLTRHDELLIFDPW